MWWSRSREAGKLVGVRAVVGLLILCAAVVSAAVLVRAGDDEAPAAPTSASAKASHQQLERVADAVTRDRDELAAQGVFVEFSYVEDGCAVVSLVNPTAPNIEYVQRRYRGACVARRRMGPIVGGGCFGAVRPPTRGGSVRVPDVQDLGLVEASRRVLAADLTFTTTCLGRARNAQWVPDEPEDELVRVVAQCPEAGQQVRPGTEVALRATTTLPGAFPFTVGPSGKCVDGRDPEPQL